jgi:lipopolysaccharide transport system ATP-binding protein
MSTPIIDVRGVSKRYRLGVIGMTSLKDEVARAWSSVQAQARRLGGGGAPVAAAPGGEFWALRDASFSVAPGDAIGIVGRNGAGKSTLLKILSRITRQTSGEIVLRGRVASLLEVGTGFHQDLTGRENVFLNGAILGMTRAEIRRKFDEIIAFADVDRFVDTPVKRYSSGMYVRLAFAVAAHLEPEILIVDEVLAVGDIAFQKKCLGKMGAVGREGRTVLFVSHNLLAVQTLCNRALLLDGGRVMADGPCDPVIRHYMDECLPGAHIALADRADRSGSGAARFTAVSLRDVHGAVVTAFRCGEPATLRLHFRNTTGQALRHIRIGVGVDDAMGQRITLFSSAAVRNAPESLAAEADAIDVSIDRVPLLPGRYGLTLFFAVNDETVDWIQHAGTFDVEPGDYFGTGKLFGDQGHFVMDHRFSVTELPVSC